MFCHVSGWEYRVCWFFFFQLLSWMFQHVCLDTCCFEFLMHVFCIFVFAPVQCN